MLRRVGRSLGQSIASHRNSATAFLPFRASVTEATETPRASFDNVSPFSNARLRIDSTSAAKELVQSLGQDQKRYLLSALHESASLGSTAAKEDAVAEQIFRGADRRYPRGFLDRAEFHQALRAHKLREEQARYIRDRLPVPMSRLFPLAVATGVPFIGFGFLDNFIMISAGESIEHLFGLTLGISIMGAAALGNLLSDVAGVCLAENIESTARRWFGLQAPPLSRYQQSTAPVRVARTLGALLGVSVGCILGMVPLLWFDPLTEPHLVPEE